MRMPGEHRIDVDGATLRCRIDGREGGRWIVFSNSLLTDLGVWDAQVADLDGDYRILRYDQRGHGRSDATGAPLDFDTLGRDLLALLQRFGIERCTFVGLSMGVPTGLSAHAKDAGRFERMVFVDGMAKTAPGGAAAWDERIGLATAEGMERLADATAARWLQPEALDGPSGEKLRTMIAATPLSGFVQCARALQGYDYGDEVGRVRCPLYAIAGESDGAVPDTMNRVFGRVAAAPVKLIERSGHIPNYEQPEAFNAALRQCLEDRA